MLAVEIDCIVPAVVNCAVPLTALNAEPFTKMNCLLVAGEETPNPAP